MGDPSNKKKDEKQMTQLRRLVAISILALGILAMAMSTAMFAKSVGEFFRLAPLHTLSMLAYGLGALNGIRVVYFARANARMASRQATR